MTEQPEPRVTPCGNYLDALESLFARYGLQLVTVHDTAAIPGTFWGEPEAGLVGNRLYVRHDTPVHSAFHEACHYVCMDAQRRSMLDTDAGGSVAEENGVCYLQVLLADLLPGYDRHRMMQDMDAWGYSFRLGSARAWFEDDAVDASEWLTRHGLLDAEGRPTFRIRTEQ